MQNISGKTLILGDVNSTINLETINDLGDEALELTTITSSDEEKIVSISMIFRKNDWIAEVGSFSLDETKIQETKTNVRIVAKLIEEEL
jgi:hypothetical protein